MRSKKNKFFLRFIKQSKKIIFFGFIVFLILFYYKIIKKTEIKIKSRQEGDEVKLNENTLKPPQSKNFNQGAKWEIPKNEILIDVLEEDTNYDGLKEIFVVSEKTGEKKACFYIFNQQKEKIYYKESGLAPDRIELRKFGDDIYNSFFLVFEGQFKEGFFIRWNGKEYVISEE